MPEISNPIQVRWLPEALMDLDRLDQFLRPKNARAATLAFQKINDAASTLTENPEIGAIYDDDKNFRQLIIPFGKQAYIMHYRTEGDRIYIVLSGMDERKGQLNKLYPTLLLHPTRKERNHREADQAIAERPKAGHSFQPAPHL